MTFYFFTLMCQITAVIFTFRYCPTTNPHILEILSKEYCCIDIF